MGGRAVDGHWEKALSTKEVQTVVLLGKTGNGKSSTGNTILGRRAFKSKFSSAGVTSTSELQQTVLEDGKTLNVIDTPGLFDFSVDPEFVKKEIVKCIDMAKDGVHAILVVLSTRSRFSREEGACIQSLRKIFGAKIIDYMIVVLTGGDDLERDGETLESYLGSNCPEILKEIFEMCENRYLLFDNSTTDESKKSEQLRKLIFLVNQVVDRNGGKPFTNELFLQLKREEMKLHDQEESLAGYTTHDASELMEQLQKSYQEQLKRVNETVELKLKEVIDELRQQLTEERAARVHAEAVRSQTETTLKAALINSEYEKLKLREDWDRAGKEQYQKRPISFSVFRSPLPECSIL